MSSQQGETDISRARPTSPAGSMATTVGGDIRRQKTRMIDEIKAEFQIMGLSIGDPTLKEKCEPGQDGQQLKLSTNVFGIKMQNIPVYRYDITISGTFKNKCDRKPVEFTKRSKEDVVIVDRKNMCRMVFENITQKYVDIFGTNLFALYYDLQSILYTLQSLDLGEKKELELKLTEEECSNIERLQRFSEVEMLVRKVRERFELNLNDLSHLTNDTTQQNHSLQQFIELATSQSALFDPSEHVFISGGTSFLMNPQNYGFTAQDGPDLSGSKYLAIGSHKSVRYVEGPKGRGNQHAALIVETKKTPFHHNDQTLFDKAWSILNAAVNSNNISRLGEFRYENDVHKLHHQFKTLHVQVRYRDGNSRELRVTGVTASTARKTRIEGNGLTVEEYFKERYGMELRYPCAPMATALQRGHSNFYPLEICYVMDCQRAALNQLSSRENAEMIRACAVAPNILQPQLARTVDSLHLHGSPYLDSAGITLTKIPLKIDGRRLPPPVIQFANGTSRIEADGKWNMQESFLEPAQCRMWAAFMVKPRNSNDQFQLTDFRNFLDMFVYTCRSGGMNFSMPTHSDLIDDCTADGIEDAVLLAKESGCEFILFITADFITNLHNIIKRSEQKCHIVTQDLKMNNAREIVKRGKKETLRNIVAKTNEKLGGVNYTITVQNDEIRNMISEGTLFIGLGISHPSPLSNQERARGAAPTSPSVIGYAANMREDPFDFIGDFAYDEPRRDEKFSTLTTIVEVCVERYQKSRRESPNRIIIFRNGTSEGQFAMSLQYEVPLVRYAIANKIEDKECKLTLLVSQRSHNIRIFPDPLVPDGGRKPNFNIRPGTVIDQQLTHPMQNEFYLNCHVAIQGTARTPRYTVLVDDSNFSMDIIEGFTYALSYCHKIINSPTSLPSPIYIALLYAKRGRALFSASRLRKDAIAHHDDGSLDFQSITNDLSYAQTTLCEQRVNA